MNKNNKIIEYQLFDIKDLNLTETDLEEYAKIGLELIKNDKKELANYAINAKLNKIFDDFYQNEISKSNLKKLKNKIKILIKKGV